MASGFVLKEFGNGLALAWAFSFTQQPGYERAYVIGHCFNIMINIFSVPSAFLLLYVPQIYLHPSLLFQRFGACSVLTQV